MQSKRSWTRQKPDAASADACCMHSHKSNRVRRSGVAQGRGGGEAGGGVWNDGQMLSELHLGILLCTICCRLVEAWASDSARTPQLGSTYTHTRVVSEDQGHQTAVLAVTVPLVHCVWLQLCFMMFVTYMQPVRIFSIVTGQ